MVVRGSWLHVRLEWELTGVLSVLYLQQLTSTPWWEIINSWVQYALASTYEYSRIRNIRNYSSIIYTDFGLPQIKRATQMANKRRNISDNTNQKPNVMAGNNYMQFDVWNARWNTERPQIKLTLFCFVQEVSQHFKISMVLNLIYSPKIKDFDTLNCSVYNHSKKPILFYFSIVWWKYTFIPTDLNFIISNSGRLR